MAMSAAPLELVEADEADVELWDGEEVVKGQPTRRHETLRAELLGQLLAQRRAGMLVVVSSALEEAGTAPHSDGSVIDISADPPATLVWVEVLSEADLRRGGSRLLGERRRRWLLGHGVRSLWVVAEIMGVIELTVIDASGEVQAFAPPGTAGVTMAHDAGEDHFVVDLDRLAEVAATAGDE